MGIGTAGKAERKITAEYDAFYEQLKNGTMEEALRRAHRLYIVESVLYCIRFDIKFRNIAVSGIKALLELKTPLDDLYERYLASGYYNGSIEDFVLDAAAQLSQERKKRLQRKW
jgi:hypothetical protein